MNEEIAMELDRFKKRMKSRRYYFGITQDELARRTGIGIATIKRMELPGYMPNFKNVLIVMNELGLSFDKLSIKKGIAVEGLYDIDFKKPGPDISGLNLGKNPFE